MGRRKERPKGDSSQGSRGAGSVLHPGAPEMRGAAVSSTGVQGAHRKAGHQAAPTWAGGCEVRPQARVLGGCSPFPLEDYMNATRVPVATSALWPQRAAAAPPCRKVSRSFLPHRCGKQSHSWEGPAVQPGSHRVCGVSLRGGLCVPKHLPCFTPRGFHPDSHRRAGLTRMAERRRALSWLGHSATVLEDTLVSLADVSFCFLLLCA